FPYSIKKVAEEMADVKVCSFRKAIEKYHIPIKDFGSNSAHLEELRGAHIIFFNEKEAKYRVRFDIGHELGHMLFGHKMNLKESDPLYGVQEVEANCFAAQLLMPEQLLRECSSRGHTISTNYIEKSFVVSDEAAGKRRSTLAKTNYEWKSRAEKEYDDIIIMRYANFLDKIAPRKFEVDYYDYDDERQLERDSWLNNRSRW
uniref:ImmA/IrrE family metallo-endopeptidase n=1 Tax=Anaerovibrio sp. TaxID=1872532 RepID=UPI0025FF418A